MEWEPITEREFCELVAAQLAMCPADLREFFARVKIPLAKWRQSPWADLGLGFWAAAVVENRVLWFNDIEDGFNVSRFEERGVIPNDEYWCNHDELRVALRIARDGGGMKAGPPEPLS